LRSSGDQDAAVLKSQIHVSGPSFEPVLGQGWIGLSCPCREFNAGRAQQARKLKCVRQIRYNRGVESVGQDNGFLVESGAAADPR
jgi:hypothetical protein